jgi:hypothetical protein
MDEPRLSWTREHVLNAIRHYFPDEDPATVLAILETYDRDSAGVPHASVQLAILKLSDGDVNKLPYYTDLAIKDFRDVLYWPGPVIPRVSMKPDDTIC